MRCCCEERGDGQEQPGSTGQVAEHTPASKQQNWQQRCLGKSRDEEGKPKGEAAGSICSVKRHQQERRKKCLALHGTIQAPKHHFKGWALLTQAIIVINEPQKKPATCPSCGSSTSMPQR